MNRFTADAMDESKRLDRFLSERQQDFTRSGLEKLFVSGKIFVNGAKKPKNYKIKTGDTVELEPEGKSPETDVNPQDLPLEILYEDEHILVVNKPSGMVVHPSSADETGTLVNALMYHLGGALSDIAGELRPGIVHRIDKDTSGLLVVAKTNEAHEGIAKQAEAHTMRRIYEGVAHGCVKASEGSIDAPIARHPVHRTKNCVPKDAKNARHSVTHYRVLQRFDRFTHMEFSLETGRMHQIRVHMAHIGHPIAGDALYGPAKVVKGLNGQCLHARTLGFIHPVTLESMTFSSELPEYFTDFLNKLSGETNEKNI